MKILSNVPSGYLACIILLFHLSSNWAWGFDLFKFVTKDCRVQDGVIFSVKDGEISILNLKGDLVTLAEADLDLVLTYNVMENPVSKIEFTAEARSLLRTIYMEDSSMTVIKGWVVGFVEDLIIVFDLSGKINVLELYQISKIRPHEERLPERVTFSHKSVLIGLDQGLTHCREVSDQGIRPTRVLADKIRIGEFIDTFEKGFEKLDSYQERTYFYARPLLFETTSRLGFFFYPSHHEVPYPQVPIYFSWGTGLPYRFQSFNTVGYAPNTLGPSHEPQFQWQSHAKSHLFHGIFVGNLGALAAGTEYFTPNRRFFEDVDYERSDLSGANHARSSASFNYLALMGIDYGAYSVSIGTGFFNYLLEVGKEFREVLGSAASPLVRLGYTGRKFSVQIVGSQTQRQIDSGVTDLQLSFDGKTSVENLFASFSLFATYGRANFLYYLTPDIDLGVDLLYLSGRYSEVKSSIASRMDFTNQSLSASIQHAFGDYVKLKAYLNYLAILQQYDFSSVVNQQKLQELVTGGSFEFVF